VLKPDQLDDVAEYVLTLSNEAQPSEASERGKEVFRVRSAVVTTAMVLTPRVLQSQGAANLTDKIWAIVNVPALKTPQEKQAAVKTFIAKGVNNNRVMPAWKDRLSHRHQVAGGLRPSVGRRPVSFGRTRSGSLLHPPFRGVKRL
jgi:cytochrome c oxidase cbb3-type subunit 3